MIWLHLYTSLFHVLRSKDQNINLHYSDLNRSSKTHFAVSQVLKGTCCMSNNLAFLMGCNGRHSHVPGLQ